MSSPFTSIVVEVALPSCVDEPLPATFCHTAKPPSAMTHATAAPANPSRNVFAPPVFLPPEGPGAPPLPLPPEPPEP